MKKNHQLLRLLVFVICFGLVWPAGADVSAQSRAKSRAKKSSRAKSRRGGSKRARSAGRSSVAPTPRPAFDKIMSENRALLNESSDAESAASQIEENKLRAHVKYLADDLLEGRGPGSRGGMLAAKYIAGQFEALGLEPADADRSFFQQVRMIGSRTDPSTKLAVKSDTGGAEFGFGDEFVAGTDIEQTEIPINSDIIFAGYGVNAPENKWDDYKGLDVRGKVLMIMVNDPPATPSEPNLFGGKALTYYGRWTYKYEEAARRGAAGVILIHTNDSAGYGWNVVRNSWNGARFGLAPEANAPSLKLKSWVTEEAARKIAQLGGKDLDQLRQSAASRAFTPAPLNVKVDMTLRTQSQRLTSPNVVAIYRGIDPTLKNEYVVYSAHWDHLGVRPDQPGDNIYNGAVDNATGVAGMIAIANAFNALGMKPRRSILFIATTAEEQGLLGAEYYASHPLVPIQQTVANINLDAMNALGVTTDITPLGADRSTLGKFIEDVAKENNVTVSPDSRPEQGSFYRSDHFPFAKAGVPAVSFNPGVKFVGHSDKWGEEQFQDYNQHRYHQPSDEYSPNWNFGGMVQQARLAFWTGLRVANATDTPQWNRGDEFERARLKSLGRAQ
ncbi:MAG TPA: M20/M25/M40 family metallo-hydrolase [Blastocatellia bacterium]|nr:M20/M25/M40 family metallo-hydrolase [Blastocatellia bacterium]